MKRLLLLVVVVVALVGAALWFSMGRAPVGPAAFVSADSVAYIALPDIKRSGERWKKTALGQIGADPAVADFLALPLSHLESAGLREARQILDKLDVKALFLAVTAVRPDGGSVVLGFEYAGTRQALDEALARLQREVAKKVPDVSQSTADHQGDKITTFSAGKPVLYSAAHGTWAFLSNDEALIRQTLDRAAGRDSSPALSASAEYRKVASQLAAQPDFVWFARFQPIVDLLMAVGGAQGAVANPAQVEQLRKVQAVGGTLVFEGVDQKEATFVLCPDLPKYASLTRSPMAFTTPGTSIFFDSVMDLQTVSSDAYFQSLPPEVQTFLTTSKIDLKAMPAIFGSDAGFLLDWPASALVPNALVAVEIKDRAQAQSLVQSLLGAFGLPVAPADRNGASVYQFPGAQLVEPSLAVTDKFLLASLTSAEMGRALGLQPGAPTLESAAGFKSAQADYRKAGIAFGYVDAKALFERIYNMVRPMAVIAGSMSPQVAGVVDVQKLPETEAISSRLGPIVYSSEQLGDGILLRSSGPVTLTQGIVLLALGAGGWAAQTMAP